MINERGTTNRTLRNFLKRNPSPHVPFSMWDEEEKRLLWGYRSKHLSANGVKYNSLIRTLRRVGSRLFKRQY